MLFSLKYLGMTLVEQPKGEELSAAAVKRIVATVSSVGAPWWEPEGRPSFLGGGAHPLHVTGIRCVRAVPASVSPCFQLKDASGEPLGRQGQGQCLLLQLL